MFAVEFFFETPLCIVVSRMFLASLTYIPLDWYMPPIHQWNLFLIFRLHIVFLDSYSMKTQL